MDNDEALKELIQAIEKNYGPADYVTVHRQSIEDSPEFKRIAGIGYTTPCEITGCNKLSVNCCCFCENAICMEHSREVISEEGYDAYACPACETEEML